MFRVLIALVVTLTLFGCSYGGEACGGGPAAFVVLKENVYPLNPMYSPQLRVFLAFDASERLLGSVIFIEGGD